MINNKWMRAAVPAILLLGSLGSVYAFSLFAKPISDYMGTSQSAVQFAFSLAIFFLGMSAAFGGKIVEKNIHRSSLVSAICFCGGLLITALAIYIKSLWLLYLGYGVVHGCGLGIGYLSPVKTLMLWFKENKGLATGISVCAFGFASTAASPMITFFNQRVPVYWTFCILSAIYFVPVMIAHFLLKKPNDWVEQQGKSDFKIRSLLKDKTFILIWVMFYLNIACGLALIPLASPIMAEKGVDGNVIAIVVSVMGIFNGAGRLVFSAASDKLKARITMYRVISVLSIMSVALAISVKSEWSIMVSLVVISACYGAGFSCLPSMLSDIYGMKNISKIHGAELSAWAIAGLTGNQISNLIHDITGDYNKVFVVLLILYTIEFLIALRVKYRKAVNND